MDIRDGNIENSTLAFDMAHAAAAQTRCAGEIDHFPSADTLKIAAPYVTLQRTIIVYLFTVVVILVIVYQVSNVKWWSSFVISLIIGQIILNVIYLPVYIDFWSEYNSYIALYTAIQLITPVVVYIYALSVAIGDTKW